MSGSIRVPDLPVLGTPTDDSLVVGDHVGTGVFTLVALRDYVLSSGGGGGSSDLTVTNITVTGAGNINGSLDVTGNTTVGGTLNATGVAVLGSTLTVVGNTGVGGTFEVVGVTTLDGALHVGGVANLNSDLNVDGNTVINGNLSVGGFISANNVAASPDGTFVLSHDAGTGDRFLQWNTGYGQYWNASNGDTSWFSPTGTLMQLTSSGHLLLMGGNTSLGSFSNTYLTLNGGDAFSAGTSGKSSLIINGSGRTPYGFEFHTNGTRLIGFDGAGAAYKPGGGTWADISDARIKQDVQDYASGLAEVTQLRPVTYRFLEETGRDTSKTYTGLIAQEAETVMPEMVRQGPADAGSLHFDDMRSLDTAALIFAVVNALKEVTTRLEALEAAPLTRSRQPDV